MHFKAGSNTPMLPLEAGDFQLDEHCNLSAVRDLSNHAEMESAFSYFLNKQHVENGILARVVCFIKTRLEASIDQFDWHILLGATSLYRALVNLSRPIFGTTASGEDATTDLVRREWSAKLLHQIFPKLVRV